MLHSGHVYNHTRPSPGRNWRLKLVAGCPPRRVGGNGLAIKMYRNAGHTFVHRSMVMSRTPRLRHWVVILGNGPGPLGKMRALHWLLHDELSCMSICDTAVCLSALPDACPSAGAFRGKGQALHIICLSLKLPTSLVKPLSGLPHN